MTFEELLQCCGSRRWVERMLEREQDDLFTAAESIWWELEPSDWLEAFAAHPRIGEKKLSGWASEEQSGIGAAPELAQLNDEYEKRFGWIFLIKATGKTAPEILAELRRRMKNEPDEELRVAAGEQAKITRLRLEKLLAV